MNTKKANKKMEKVLNIAIIRIWFTKMAMEEHEEDQRRDGKSIEHRNQEIVY